MAQLARKALLMIFSLVVSGVLCLQQPVNELIHRLVWNHVSHNIANQLTLSIDGRADPEPYDSLIFYLITYVFFILSVMFYGFFKFILFESKKKSISSALLDLLVNIGKTVFVLTTLLGIIYLIPSEIGEGSQHASLIMALLLLISALATFTLYQLLRSLFNRIRRA